MGDPGGGVTRTRLYKVGIYVLGMAAVLGALKAIEGGPPLVIAIVLIGFGTGAALFWLERKPNA